MASVLPLRLLAGVGGTRTASTVDKNIVTDYLAVSDGVADVAPNFNSFHTALNGETRQVNLTVPAGSYLFKTNVAQFFTSGIRNLRLLGAGVDITTITRQTPASAIKFGADGLTFDNLHSARFRTVLSGANSVTLLDASKASLFTVGQMCIAAGVDMQGSGDPFNNHFFQYLRVASIVGGTITFDRSLTYGFRETWPVYNDGSNYGTGGGMDQGGPGTLYALSAASDCDFTIQDMTLVAGAGVDDPFGYILGRNVTMLNVKVLGSFGLSPTNSEMCTIINPYFDGQCEVDKSLKTLLVQGGYIHKLYFQSSSVDSLTISAGALIDQVAGTPKVTTIDSSTVTLLQIGPGYGHSDSVAITNSVISAIDAGFGSNSISGQGYTMADGVITAPRANGTLLWAIPGGWCVFSNANGFVSSFQVIDIWNDASFTYVQTDQSGGFPIGATSLGQHPCPLWTCTSSTGCPEIVDLSQAGAQSRPIWEYSKRTYDQTLSNSVPAPKPLLWGEIFQIVVDVTTAYTGVGALAYSQSQFNNWTIIHADGTTSSMTLTINTKTAGRRVISASGGNTGAQTGDVLPTLQIGDRFGGVSNSGPVLSANVNGQNLGPVLSVEIETQQGIAAARAEFGGGQFLLVKNMMSPGDNQPVANRSVDHPASSTADWVFEDGLTDFVPHDLLQYGSWGAGIASAKGFRYFWPIACDHPADGSGAEGGWAYDATSIWIGFSNDPCVPPDPSTFYPIIAPNGSAFPGEVGTFVQPFQACFLYNTDDASNPAYFFTESNQQAAGNVNSLNGVLWKGPDFDHQFSPAKLSHPCTGQFGLTSFQRAYRLGTGNFVSWGGGDPANNGGTIAKWTSTDTTDPLFTVGALVTKQVNSSGVAVTGAVSNGWQKNYSYGGFRFQIGSDWYIPSNEDCRGPGWGSGTTYASGERVNVNQRTYQSLQNSNTNHAPQSSPTWWTDLGYLGQYVTLVPVDGTTGDMILTGTPPVIRLSGAYRGQYPKANYLQYVLNYVEDGVCIVNAVHGMFGDTGIVRDVLPEDGGGLNEQYVDVYPYVFDATAAATSAPFGVKVSCAGSVVTLSWLDVLVGSTYRVKRGTAFGTYGMTLGDVAGTRYVDGPTAGSVYYYQVIRLSGGVEQQARVVSTFVS